MTTSTERRKGELEQLLAAAEREQDELLANATDGKVRSQQKAAAARARVCSLRSELAKLGDLPELATKWAKLELSYQHEFRQLAKVVIADELDELRARVLEGDRLEAAAAEYPETLPCDRGQSGTERESSTGSASTSTPGSSTSR